MRIEQAIVILKILMKLTPASDRAYRIKAINLGIEALKRIQASREHFARVFPTPLPGETED